MCYIALSFSHDVNFPTLTLTAPMSKPLGTPDPAGAMERIRVARKAQAAQFAVNVLPIIGDIQTTRHIHFNAIAA